MLLSRSYFYCGTCLARVPSDVFIAATEVGAFGIVDIGIEPYLALAVVAVLPSAVTAALLVVDADSVVAGIEVVIWRIFLVGVGECNLWYAVDDIL